MVPSYMAQMFGGAQPSAVSSPQFNAGQMPGGYDDLLRRRMRQLKGGGIAGKGIGGFRPFQGYHAGSYSGGIGGLTDPPGEGGSSDNVPNANAPIPGSANDPGSNAYAAQNPAIGQDLAGAMAQGYNSGGPILNPFTIGDPGQSQNLINAYDQNQAGGPQVGGFQFVPNSPGSDYMRGSSLPSPQSNINLGSGNFLDLLYGDQGARRGGNPLYGSYSYSQQARQGRPI